MKNEFVVESGKERLDKFLAGQLRSLSRSHLKGLIERGCVRVFGTVRPPDYRTCQGDRVVIVFPQAPESPGKLRDWVIHEDKDLMVLNKPSGLLMHPLGTSWLNSPEAAVSDPQPNLAAILLREMKSAGGVTRCGIVHRLDRATSGVLLVAKTQPAYEALILAFKKREVSKIYRAIVRGKPHTRETIVEAPVGRIQGFRKVKVTPFGRASSTSFTLIDSCPHAALVQARPLTGRTHQIRAHLAHLGNPVLGDPEFKTRGIDLKPPRLMLHAYRIEASHPGTGRRRAFSAPLPGDFKDYWDELKKV